MKKIRSVCASFLAAAFMLLLCARCGNNPVNTGSSTGTSGTLILNVDWGTCGSLISGSSNAVVRIYVDRVTNNSATNPILESFRNYQYSMNNSQIQKDFSIEKPASGSYMITVEVETTQCLACVNNCSQNPPNSIGKPIFRTVRTFINQGANSGGFTDIFTAVRITTPNCNC